MHISVYRCTCAPPWMPADNPGEHGLPQAYVDAFNGTGRPQYYDVIFINGRQALRVGRPTLPALHRRVRGSADVQLCAGRLLIGFCRSEWGAGWPAAGQCAGHRGWECQQGSLAWAGWAGWGGVGGAGVGRGWAGGCGTCANTCGSMACRASQLGLPAGPLSWVSQLGLSAGTPKGAREPWPPLVKQLSIS